MHRGRAFNRRGCLTALLLLAVAAIGALLLTTPVQAFPILSTEGGGGANSGSIATADSRNESQYGDEVAPDTAEVLLQWKETLPRGSCLGCTDGPLFGSWSRRHSVCAWNGTRAARESLGAPPAIGVLDCNETTQSFLKLSVPVAHFATALHTLRLKI
jgi:hypothetical protein